MVKLMARYFRNKAPLDSVIPLEHFKKLAKQPTNSFLQPEIFNFSAIVLISVDKFVEKQLTNR